MARFARHTKGGGKGETWFPLYKWFNKNNTNKYDNMAKNIATAHIGTTVLCLYPTPNGLYAPFGK